jgi:eukaryotic-like serine/threonine-protein kinase
MELRHRRHGGFLARAVANGVVHVGSWDYSMYALNARTGAPLGYSYPIEVANASPAVANGVLYFGSYYGVVYAFGLKKGRE